MRAVAQDEERLTREDTTPAVHFLKFAFTRRSRSTRSRRGRCASSSTTPRTARTCELDGAQRAELARRPRGDGVGPRRCRSPFAASIPSSRCRRAAARRRRRLRPPRPGGVSARARRRARRSCPTGIAVAIPAGYAGFVQPRSGLALQHGITCLNTPGLIDAQYRDEISVLLVNTDPTEPFTINRGDRIAQLVIQRVETVEWHEVDDARRVPSAGSAVRVRPAHAERALAYIAAPWPTTADSDSD